MYLTVCVGSAVKQTSNTQRSSTVTEGKWQGSYRLFIGKQLFPDPEEVLAKLSQALNEAFLCEMERKRERGKKVSVRLVS